MGTLASFSDALKARGGRFENREQRKRKKEVAAIRQTLRELERRVATLGSEDPDDEPPPAGSQACRPEEGTPPRRTAQTNLYEFHPTRKEKGSLGLLLAA